MQSNDNRVGRPSGVVLDGELMRNRRRVLAMSQSDLAHAARLGVRTVRAAEAGKPMSTDTAMQIAMALGTPYIVLMQRTPEEIQGRLLERGYAPLEPPRMWMTRPEVEQVRTWLQEAQGAVQVCVRGRAGIGKSALVRRVVQDLGETFPEGMVWVTASNLADDTRVRRMQLDLAACLGFAELLPDPELVPTEAFDRAFARRFWQRKRLLVLDDLAEPDDLRRLLDPEQDAQIIVTTATRYVAERIDGHQLHLERWSDDTTKALLSEVLGEQRLKGDPAGAQALAELASGVPLSVRTLAEALKRRRYTTPASFVEEVRNEGLDGLGVPADARVGALYVFQDRPFTVPFARVATGLEDASVRTLLEELSDMYLLREAPTHDVGAGPRFQIDAGSRHGIWSSEEANKAMDRLLDEGADLARELIAGVSSSTAQAELLEASLPMWRLILDEGARRLLGDFRAARTPDDLPVPKRGSEHFLLPTILRALTPLLLMRPPAETPEWLTAGMAAARASGDRLAQRDLSALLMLSWWLGRQRFAPADRWGVEATRLGMELGPPDWAVSCVLFAAIPAFYERGRESAVTMLEQARQIDEASPAERACVLGCLGALAVYAGNIQRADQLMTEALDVLQHAGDEYRTILQAELLLNQGAVRLIAGRELPPADKLAQAVTEVLNTFAGSSLLEAQVVSMAERFGVKGDWKAPTAAESFLAVPPELIHSRLLRLSGAVVELGQPPTNVKHPGPIQTPIGPWSTVTTPYAPREGHPPLAMYLLVPVEPLREMLTGHGLDLALRFVESVRSRHDATYKALATLRTPDAEPAT